MAVLFHWHFDLFVPWVPETFLARFPVFAASGFGLRPKMCRSSANTENSRRTGEKPLVTRVTFSTFRYNKLRHLRVCWGRNGAYNGVWTGVIFSALPLVAGCPCLAPPPSLCTCLGPPEKREKITHVSVPVSQTDSRISPGSSIFLAPGLTPTEN